MSRDVLEVFQQDLRIAKQLASLMQEHCGFASVCQSHATQRLLCDTLAGLICVLSGKPQSARLPLRSLITDLSLQSDHLPALRSGLADTSSWLYQLSDTQESFAHVFRSKPEEHPQSSAVIFSTASSARKKHWTQITPEQLELWCMELESVLDAAIALQDEY